MKFWPDDIAPEDLRVPHAILQEAAAELAEATGLKVIVRTESLADRVLHTFEASNPAADTVLQVFTAAHQLEFPYPAVFDPPRIKTPDFLKPVRHVGPGTVVVVTKGHTVNNPWVCAAASEFEKKLREICGSEAVKTLLHRLQYARGAQTAPGVFGGQVSTDAAPPDELGE